ncbi:MAG TPA: hypothetical protein P5084_15690 [Paludibacter sp.]|nr:hypothetical protein [Paludibacter sp.]
MTIKTAFIFFIIACLISICGWFLIDSNKRLIEEVQRLELNQTVLNGTIKSYITKSGKQAVSIAQLNYNLNEFKKYQSEDVKTIKDLGLKLKQVETMIKVGITTVIRDTLIMRDTVIIDDTVSIFRKKDNYIDLTGVVRHDTVLLDFMHNDTISNIAHWTYKKWFIFKCKTDVIQLESVNKSPYSKINWNQFIKIKK